jgi:hypothetical protein
VENGSPIWANVNFDPFLFVVSAFEDPKPDFSVSEDPPILRGSSAYCMFECELDGSTVTLRLLSGKVLDVKLRAINRGFNALIEACVHATRYKAGMKHLEEKIRYYGTIIEKCGGKREKEAYKLLLEYINL